MGSSEVHLGKLADGRLFVATIEPWHGNEVAVCVGKKPGQLSGGGGIRGPSSTTALDDGHALWVADVDGDGDDEIFAGHRGKDHRVSVYDFNGKTWDRTVIDPNLGARTPRRRPRRRRHTGHRQHRGKSHNVVWFRPSNEESPDRTLRGRGHFRSASHFLARR